MVLKGRVWKFGDNVDTDVIIPVQYCSSLDMEEFGRHCMEGIDPDFSRKVGKGDIIVAKRNFGCGSSREPAPLAIKAAGISCVIARSFARIFYRNAFNVGLPLIECDEAPELVQEGDVIEIDLDTGEIRSTTTKQVFRAKPIPPFMQQIIRDGGLLNHIIKELHRGQNSSNEGVSTPGR